MSPTSTLTPSITPELTATLRRLKLGQLIDTLPERLALAKSSKMSYAEFLQLLLADEVSDVYKRQHRPSGLHPSSPRSLLAPVTYDCLLYTSRCV